ncbi:hypothetical protein NB699_003510 [Xanthomonas sacchari]|uniref:Uncharacterized protein n=1 Tax=Xanthomonas sacchari TaxID=56458 RepID=A0AA46Y8V7_9XANT|nr:hypothetical protein [Xanthomonas sacchari]MCW0368527.1 hypothetical protein [Xanthomonas sacchari]MCW0442670.1 hypothetical protein [Xanthomonas sacchari]UYK88933.1 hypothetical protein NG824_00230 [Xanthomonas sacchari]
MTDARKNRTRFNNIWPATFLFPAEEALVHRLAKHNLVSIFLPANLVHVENHGFHSLLAHCIDALDYLPLRPDFAFDQIWKALDAEFFRLVEVSANTNSQSRFSVFATYIASSPNCSNSHFALAPHIPLQTCEFFAKRLLDSTAYPNEQHSEKFMKRVKATLGAGLLAAIGAKYDIDWLMPDKRADTQRRLGGLFKLIIGGNKITLDANSYQLSPAEVARLLISTVLPQFRNERFHGSVRPPFRSSSATLKTYAHSYFLLIYAYALICEVFLYRAFGVLSTQDVVDTTSTNLNRLLQVLGDQESA